MGFGQNNTALTPLVRRIPDSGGAFYTFPSSAEDMVMAFTDSPSHKFRFSKFALIRIPDILNEPEKNTIRPHILTDIGQSHSVDWNHTFAESFQNYCLNLETGILSDPNYNSLNYKTVSERVFWKWIKEMGGIRWSDLGGIKSIKTGNPFLFSEEEDSKDYDRVVKYLGEFSASGVQQNQFATYTELFLQVPEIVGATQNPQFISNADSNFYNGQVVTSIAGESSEFVFGRKLYDPHIDNLSINAIFDKDDDFSTLSDPEIAQKGDYRFKRESHNSTDVLFTYTNGELQGDWKPNQWWYSKYATNNSYFIKSGFITPTPTDFLPTKIEEIRENLNSEYAIYRGRISSLKNPSSTGDVYKTTNTIRFKRSNLEGMELNWELNDYGQNNWIDLAQTPDASNFDFNAVLVYYDLYDDSNGNPNSPNVLSTNLFGILFLDNVKPFSGSGGRIESFRKIKSNESLNVGGNEFGIKINFKVDTNTRLVNVTHIPVIAENNTVAMGMFMEALAKMVSVSDFISKMEAKSLTLTSDVQSIRNRVGDTTQMESILERLSELENFISSRADFSELNNFNNLVALYTEISRKLDVFLTGKFPDTWMVDTTNLIGKGGITITKNDGKVVIQNKETNFTYGNSPIVKYSQFIPFDNKWKINHLLTSGKNYLRIENDVPNFDTQKDILVVIDTVNNKWVSGQSMKVQFQNHCDFPRINFALLNPDSTLTNIGVVESISNGVEIHCGDSNRMVFYLDRF